MTAIGPIEQSAVDAFWERAVGADTVSPDDERPVVVEVFGDSRELADQLIELVVHGPKRATAAALADYQHAGDPLPVVGVLWVAVDGDGRPRALLRTTDVRIGPFTSVDDSFAWDEGEDDRTRDSWLIEHERYFRRSLPTIGEQFSDDMLTVFERFDLLYSE